MKCPSYALVMFVLLGRFCATLSQYEQDRQVLEEYAREADKLFNAIPGWDATGGYDYYDSGSGEVYDSPPSSPVKTAFFKHSSATGDNFEQVGSNAEQSEDSREFVPITNYPNIPFPRYFSPTTPPPTPYPPPPPPPELIKIGRSELSPRTIGIIGTRGFDELNQASPFEIDEQDYFDSTESEECLRDHHHVTISFKECIYKLEMSSPNKNVISSDESHHGNETKFLKYCRKAPQLRDCVKNTILAKMEACFDEGLKETMGNVENITTAMIRVICNDEADRIAIFIKDGGFTCLQDNTVGVLTCLSQNIAGHVLSSLFDLPSLQLTIGKCKHLELAEKCVDQELMVSCKNRALVFMVGVVFDIAKEMASCGNTTFVNTTVLARITDEVQADEGFVTTPGHHEDPVENATSVTWAAVVSITELTLTETPDVNGTHFNEDETNSSLCLSEGIVAIVICAFIIISLIATLSLTRLVTIQSRIQPSVKSC